MSGDVKSEGVLRDTKPGMCGLYHSWAELGMVGNVLLVHRGDLLVDNDQKVPSLEHLPLCHQMSCPLKQRYRTLHFACRQT